MIKTAEFGAETDRDKRAERPAFVERLQLILSHWPSADRLARAMGVSPSAFRKWLKGEAEPSRERLVALAHAAGVGVAWLAEGQGPEPTFETVQSSLSRTGGREVSSVLADWTQFTLLPDRSPRASADDAAGGRRLDMNPWIALRSDWIRTVCRVEPEDLLVEMATCESMRPTIREGHTLLVDTKDRTFRNFGIYVLEIEGHRIVTRVQHMHDGSLVLINDNVAYHPDVVDKSAAKDLVVIGRVVWAGGML